MLSLLAATNCSAALTTILWIVAAIVVIYGIVSLVRGAVVMGLVLIVVGLLIGPGGASFIC